MKNKFYEDWNTHNYSFYVSLCEIFGKLIKNIFTGKWIIESSTQWVTNKVNILSIYI